MRRHFMLVVPEDGDPFVESEGSERRAERKLLSHYRQVISDLNATIRNLEANRVRSGWPTEAAEAYRAGHAAGEKIRELEEELKGTQNVYAICRQEKADLEADLNVANGFIEDWMAWAEDLRYHGLLNGGSEAQWGSSGGLVRRERIAYTISGYANRIKQARDVLGRTD